ncbi:sperm acrosome membrane-associated protein 4 [Nematolebias whitei]|uniref:sperm acrosome membrane-associated protein 4 n=1 Tax=Nematolebias whitei TaxID=451745 RepID=UPI00189BE0C1|nr:sperm acrosome membrane-associated protein 4 [Nematolebias whitei]
MKTLVFLLAVAFCFAVGQTLKCYQCQIGFWNLCFTKEVTCQDGEKCFSGDGKAAGFVSVKMKGCLVVANCNKTTDESISISNSSATLYKMTKTCCNTDLCNGAPGLPGASGLSLALATISALFVANILV